jgi:tetratricopeptide (TPR) repeat protein
MFHEDAHTRKEIKRLSKLVKKQPLLFARLGECHFRLGDPDRAEPILTRGLEAFPDYASGLLILGEVYLYKGFLRDAEECVNRGLAKNPHHLGLLQLMLRLQKSMEDQNQVQQLKTLIKTLDPLHVPEDLDEEGAQAFKEEGEEVAPPPPKPLPPSIWKQKAEARRQREAEEAQALAEAQAQIPEPVPKSAPESLPDLTEVLSEITAPAPEVTTTAVSEFNEFESEPEAEVESPPPAKKIATKTLGELYARQNKFDEAIEIYESLTAEHPDNESYSRRLEDLRTAREALLASQSQGSDPA